MYWASMFFTILTEDLDVAKKVKHTRLKSSLSLPGTYKVRRYQKSAATFIRQSSMFGSSLSVISQVVRI